MAVVRKLWEFEPGTIEPRPDNMGRFLPPEVSLTNEDRDRIAVARGLNSITRAYIMGLLAGMRRR